MIKWRSIYFGKKKKLILASVFLAVAMGSFIFANQIFNLVDVNPNSTSETSQVDTTTDNLDKAAAAEVPKDDSSDNKDSKDDSQDSESSEVLGEVEDNSSSTVPGPTPSSPNSTSKIYIVKYTKYCYTPSIANIHKGDTIKFVNYYERKFMWPITLDKVYNQLYPEFNARKAIPFNGVFSFTFKKIGNWGYYDNLKPSCHGVVVVK
jgi:plastocyanin